MKVRKILCTKSLVLLLVLISFIALVLPIAFGNGVTINKTKASELMYQYSKEQLGYEKDVLLPNNLVQSSEGDWLFSLFVKDASPETNGIITGVISKEGKLLEIMAPVAISKFQQISNEFDRSERSYEDMYQMKVKWEVALDRLTDDELVEFMRYASVFPVISILKHDISIPIATDISYDEAKANADKAIVDIHGWTQEMLEHIAIRMAVYHTPVNSDRSVYQFVYELKSGIDHLDALLLQSPYTFDYDKAFKEERLIFGEALPYGVNVRIDAQTGLVVGTVDIVVPPVPDGFPYYFILQE